MINSEIGNNSRRELAPERWELIKAATVARAHDMRAQTLRDFAVWLASRPASHLRGWAQAVGAWWAQRSAVRELQGLDNRILRDMGIARSEIEYLVAGGDPERRMPRKAAVRAPCAAPNAARSRDVTIERRPRSVALELNDDIATSAVWSLSRLRGGVGNACTKSVSVPPP